jgi:hypothetical protein
LAKQDKSSEDGGICDNAQTLSNFSMLANLVLFQKLCEKAFCGATIKLL